MCPHLQGGVDAGPHQQPGGALHGADHRQGHQDRARLDHQRLGTLSLPVGGATCDITGHRRGGTGAVSFNPLAQPAEEETELKGCQAALLPHAHQDTQHLVPTTSGSQGISKNPRETLQLGPPSGVLQAEMTPHRPPHTGSASLASAQHWDGGGRGRGGVASLKEAASQALSGQRTQLLSGSQFVAEPPATVGGAASWGDVGAKGEIVI